MAIHNVAAAVAAPGPPGREGATLRKTLRPTADYGGITGVLTLGAIDVPGGRDRPAAR